MITKVISQILKDEKSMLFQRTILMQLTTDSLILLVMLKVKVQLRGGYVLMLAL